MKMYSMVYRERDSRKGCPPTAKPDSVLIAKTFKATEKVIVVAQGNMIRRAKGRLDLKLFVDNSVRDR